MRWGLGVMSLAIFLALPSAVGAGADKPAITTLYPVAHPRGLIVTSAGWPYCQQLRKLAPRSGYALLCGRYWKDGYTGLHLRDLRHLDWGDPGYLSAFAQIIRATHKQIGGKLVLLGVSGSGFAVATLAAHHPEIRPDRLIVIDSYLDLLARRLALSPTQKTAREIDEETGGSAAALKARSVSASGLATLVRHGTKLAVIWSVSAGEQREFNGATCDLDANAATLSRLAQTLGSPVRAWVTTGRHGYDLWNHGAAIMAGRYPGRAVSFGSDGRIPPGSVCK